MPEKSYLLPAHPFSAAGGKPASVCQASLVEGGAPGWGDFVSGVVKVDRWGFLWERRGPVPVPPRPSFLALVLPVASVGGRDQLWPLGLLCNRRPGLLQAASLQAHPCPPALG